MLFFLLLLAIVGLSQASSISLSVTPTSFYCGDIVRFEWSSSGATTPLKLFLKGSISQWTYWTISNLGDSGDSTQTPTGCESLGSFYFSLSDNAWFWTSSNSVYVTVLAPSITVSASPSTFYAGDSVNVTWLTKGLVNGPFKVSIVGFLSYNTNLWTWPGTSITTSGTSDSNLVIPASLVSSGSYYIVVGYNGDYYGSYAVTVLAPSITVSASPSTFSAGDSVNVTWLTHGLVSGPFKVSIVSASLFNFGIWSWSGTSITQSGISGLNYSISASLVSYGSYELVVGSSSSVSGHVGVTVAKSLIPALPCSSAEILDMPEPADITMDYFYPVNVCSLARTERSYVSGILNVMIANSEMCTLAVSVASGSRCSGISTVPTGEHPTDVPEPTIIRSIFFYGEFKSTPACGGDGIACCVIIATTEESQPCIISVKADYSFTDRSEGISSMSTFTCSALPSSAYIGTQLSPESVKILLLSVTSAVMNVGCSSCDVKITNIIDEAGVVVYTNTSSRRLLGDVSRRLAGALTISYSVFGYNPTLVSAATTPSDPSFSSAFETTILNTYANVRAQSSLSPTPSATLSQGASPSTSGTVSPSPTSSISHGASPSNTGTTTPTPRHVVSASSSPAPCTFEQSPYAVSNTDPNFIHWYPAATCQVSGVNGGRYSVVVQNPSACDLEVYLTHGVSCTNSGYTDIPPKDSNYFSSARSSFSWTDEPCSSNACCVVIGSNSVQACTVYVTASYTLSAYENALAASKEVLAFLLERPYIFAIIGVVLMCIVGYVFWRYNMCCCHYAEVSGKISPDPTND